MKFILGIKQNMTQVFDESGVVHPATVVKTGDMVVTQIKTVEKDGYSAIQVGFGERKEKNINKPLKGQMKGGSYMYLFEIPVEEGKVYNIGDTIDASSLKAGDMVTISSISKGKGFQGVVKRHGFHGGPRSHGQKHSEREAGSIGGAGRDGGRVAKGKRMAGRMGSDRITTKSLTIVSINPETKEVFIRGAIAGRRGTVVEIKA
ncbi:MAG: 50S ribosomal protein L3 [Candidatus Paceibacterota bacterium]